MSNVSLILPGANIRIRVSEVDTEAILERTWRVRERGSSFQIFTSVRTPQGSRNVALPLYILGPCAGKVAVQIDKTKPFDFTRENLRHLTLSSRSATFLKTKRETSSQYKGVSFNKDKMRWRAQVEIAGCITVVGEFETEAEAAEAYNKVAKRTFGSIAFRNEIETAPKRRRTKKYGS